MKQNFIAKENKIQLATSDLVRRDTGNQNTDQTNKEPKQKPKS